MSGICGWSIGRAAHNGTSEELANLADGLDQSPNQAGDNMILGQRVALAVTASNGRPEIAKCGSLIAAITGSYYWTDRDLQELSAEGNPAKALVDGYRKYGDSLPLYLSGSFSFAIGDDDSGEFLIAVDRFCSRQIAYFEHDGTLVFASNTNALRRHRYFKGEVSPDAIYSYLYFHNVPLPMGVFQNVTRVKPGHRLSWRAHGADSTCYFPIRFDEEYGTRGTRQLAEEIRQILLEEVRNLAEGDNTGTFLSGGIDSSTLTGMLTHVAGPCQSFSIGFDAENYDEMSFARSVAEHFKSTHHEYYVTPQDVITAVPKVAAVNSEPFGNASAIPTYFCAKLANEHGIQRLLGGDGGDELFGGNERYAYQKLLSPYGKLPGPIRMMLEKVFLSDRGQKSRITRKVSNYIRKSSTPLPDRLFLDTEVSSIGTSTVLTPEFLDTIDEQLPIHMIREVYLAASLDSELSAHLALDWHFTLACSDLPKVTNMCDLAGVGIAYPFLTNSVVDFSTHLPDKSKVNRLRLRHFFKEAVREILPSQTIKKSKHGFGLPYGLWVRENGPLRDFTRDNLSSLKSRGIIRVKFIDELFEKMLFVHPAYYGAMIWVLLMLEQFYQAHVDNQPR